MMSTKPQPPSPAPSLRPPPVDGTGKYLAIILLLGGGIVGLFAWRHFQPEPVAPAPPPSASAALLASHAPHDEPIDIPPPPAVPDATPDTGAVKPATATGGGGGDGCAQKTCGGSINAELSSALAFRAKTAHKCYDEALALDSTLQGQVVINVRVGTNGAVCSASVASNDLPSPGVAPCIANRFRQGARLPSPTGGCIDANVPMRLLPAH